MSSSACSARERCLPGFRLARANRSPSPPRASPHRCADSSPHWDYRRPTNGIVWRTMCSITSWIMRCLRQSILGIRVIRFNFIAEIPMAEQAKLGWKRPLAVLIKQVVHPDVVLRDIFGGIAARLRNRQIYVRGNALENICARRPRPTAAASTWDLASSVPRA